MTQNEICPKCRGAGTLPKICKLCKWYKLEDNAAICTAPVPIVAYNCKIHYTEPYRDADKCECWKLRE